MVSEPTCWTLCCRGAGCLSGVGTYMPDTVLQGCRLVKRCQNLPWGTLGQWCRLFKRCRNLPPGHWLTRAACCLSGSEPTSWALLGSGAGCLSGVSYYLPRGGTRYCSTFYFRTYQVSLGSCNCFCLGVPSFFLERERDLFS